MSVKVKSLLLTLLSFLTALFVVVSFSTFKFQTASASVLTLQGQGDEFVLTDNYYDNNDSFVYSSRATFVSGQAVGLVFGATEGESYWVFNVDRFENAVKLMHFTTKQDGGYNVNVLKSDYFIGNDKMTDSERGLVNGKLQHCPSFQLKVIISVESDGVHAEFFANNIKRFGVDSDIVLDSFATEYPNAIYQGGSLGYNCFNANVSIDEEYVGETDYSYYTELYRQQYHFSQYNGWNNDPNGLVYYDGYYHIFYQHHPFANHWDDMYWGHARSTDLLHWELLPICLFPDGEVDGWGPGNGYMWSGSAMVYHKEMSADIDSRNWFPNGNGDGLIAFYTRDGGLQDQVLMSSDDGGITWTKRVRIPQTLVVGPQKTDCRDPKIFPVKKDGDTVTLWGMALTGMATGDIWFMKSTNLIDWTSAGGFKGFIGETHYNFRSECPDVVFIQADDNTTRAVLTLTARYYLVGDIAYDETSGKIQFLDLNGTDISTLPVEEIPYQVMDYGPDSYATQTFYIDDTNSEYYGETIGINWFSGVPRAERSIESGSLAALRKIWNGGGMTIPVKYGLVKNGNGYLLSLTPIVEDTDKLDKENVVSIENQTVVANTNALDGVSARRYELSATISNPNKANIEFRVGVSETEYTSIGWNAVDGYYVDRSNTADGGLYMPGYRVKYTSGAIDGDEQTFYILVDDGGIEVFCENKTTPFYVLTFISPYSTGLSFVANEEVTIKELTINEIGTVWRSGVSNETVLYVDKENVELDLSFTTTAKVIAYATTDTQVDWEVVSGSDVIDVLDNGTTITLTSKKEGTAIVKATCGNAEKLINVTVYGGSKEFDVTFTSNKIKSGNWYMTANGIIGKSPSGDGFIFSQQQGANFNYVVKFDLTQATASAIAFRANADFTDYYVATFDKNDNVIKLWSPSGDLAVVGVQVTNYSAVVVGVKAEGNVLTISCNGREVLNYVDERANAPLDGYFGLNVYNGTAIFNDVSLVRGNYVFDGSDLTVKFDVEQYVSKVRNLTLDAIVPSDYYSCNGNSLTLTSKYFTILTATGEYTFLIEGAISVTEIKVTVQTIPTVSLTNITIKTGENAVFFIGALTVDSVKVNGEELTEEDFTLKDYTLSINSNKLIEGDNAVVVNQNLNATVTVEAQSTSEIEKTTESGCNGDITSNALILIIVSALCLVSVKLLKKEN